MSDEITAGIIGAGAGLVGALIGAYAGYRFNEKLEATRTKERRQVQTKNTIFSPIYKQLTGLKAFLDNRQNPLAPNISVHFANDRYHGGLSYTFDIWESMKRDIRKLYIPVSKREELDKLTKVIVDHMNLQQVVQASIIQIAVSFAAEHRDRLKTPSSWNPRFMGNALDVYSSGIAYPRIKDDIKEHLNSGFNFSPEEQDQFATELLKRVDEHENQKRLINSFNHVMSTIVLVTESFETLVSEIITKYEGGVDVK